MAFNHAFHLLLFWLLWSLWLQLTNNHSRDRFQAFAHRHLKWLSCSIGTWAEPFSWTGCQFRSAALIQIMWICSYALFYSETNEWSKDWAKRFALLWLVTSFRQIHGKFHFTWKKNLSSVTRHRLNIANHRMSVSIARVEALFPQASLQRPAATAAD